MKSMSQKAFLTTAGIIFSVIGILHLLRAILGWDAIIGSFSIPAWFSWLGIVVAAFLAYNAFSLSR